jgi:hypothetical protein
MLPIQIQRTDLTKILKMREIIRHIYGLALLENATVLWINDTELWKATFEEKADSTLIQHRETKASGEASLLCRLYL